MAVRLCKDHWSHFRREMLGVGLPVQAITEEDAYSVMEKVASSEVTDPEARDVVFVNPDPAVEAYLRMLLKYGMAAGWPHIIFAKKCPLCYLEKKEGAELSQSLIESTIEDQLYVWRKRGDIPAVQ